jgi:acetyl-CoA carboxylase biotin carboxylase subunit
VPPHYDSLLSKLIVWAPTRQEAIARGKRALGEYEIEGVPTTIPFHLKLLEHDTFVRGEAYTNFLADHGEEFGIKG